jgi:hypothetical protein
VKYLGPNLDNSYQRAGPDGLLGTEDDEYFWKKDDSKEIGPCNETKDHGTNQVRNIVVTPSIIEVIKGGTVQFSAAVFMSDNSPNSAGVTWKVEPSGDASIDNSGLLTVNPGAVAGTLTVTATSIANTAISQPASVIVKSAITDVPESVNGRILTTTQTGDSSEWIEIARNGDYSLIARKDYISISINGHGNPDFQYTGFGSDNVYSTSAVRTAINDWFRGTAVNGADKLPTDARLRSYTVRNNVLDAIGTGAVASAKNDGFSKPLEIADGNGYDVAFALSYGEAANFNSKMYSWEGGGFAASSQLAQNNFAKMVLHTGSSYSGYWLRSPGNTSRAAATVSYTGNVFQGNINGTSVEYALVYPALWVKSTVFEG